MGARYLQGRLTRALVIEGPDPLLDEELARVGIKVERLVDVPDEEGLVRALQRGRHHLLFKRSSVRVTERVIAASPELAAVMLCCIGDDSVDKAACARHGVLVTNDPISNGRSVAELVIGEIIALSRRVFDSVVEMQASSWKKDNQARYEVLGKRLGILGLGNIGRQVAQLAQALGLEVSFFDTGEVAREVGRAMGYRAASSIQDLFRSCDFVTVHVSAEDVHGRSNRGLLTYDLLKELGQRPADSPRVLLNLARGFLFEPDDLRRAVREGHIRYAMTDVFPDEPHSAATNQWKNPYEGEPRILATPHIGAATREAQPRIAHYVARTAHLLSHYGMLRNCVFAPRANIEFDLESAKAVLAIVHSDRRGTKKTVDDVIYEAGASNLRSAHVDFPHQGIAYDLSALDRPLEEAQVLAVGEQARALTGDPDAVRWIRHISLAQEGSL
jgi:D-3-phosphoglycerate dehydrogenase